MENGVWIDRRARAALIGSATPRSAKDFGGTFDSFSCGSRFACLETAEEGTRSSSHRAAGLPSVANTVATKNAESCKPEGLQDSTKRLSHLRPELVKREPFGVSVGACSARRRGYIRHGINDSDPGDLLLRGEWRRTPTKQHDRSG